MTSLVPAWPHGQNQHGSGGRHSTLPTVVEVEVDIQHRIEPRLHQFHYILLHPTIYIGKQQTCVRHSQQTFFANWCSEAGNC